MSFGRRSAERERLVPSSQASWAVPLIPAAVAVGVVLFAGLAIAMSRQPDHNDLLEKAAVKLGVTSEVRAALRQQLLKAMHDMDRELCDESLRDRAGRAAVQYYETLLEKPVTEAGLEMTYHNRCQLRLNRGSHPFERLFSVSGIGSNLTLPWDCLPDHWRTPIDRAIQAKLEQVLRAGYLTNDSLKGTLAMLARPTKLSPISSLCNRPSYSSDRRRELPLISAPTDDWDRTPRRRRW
jgi:hypothetical protein